MLLSDRQCLLDALSPVNKTRLDDQNMLDVWSALNRGIRIPIIDSTWTTQLLGNPNQERQREYLERIRVVITGVTDNSQSPLILFPLFEDEHWSLLVLIRRTSTLFHYFHIDSSQPNHTAYCASLLDRIRPLLTGTGLFVLPKDVSQQAGDWECGHFVLMNIQMLLDLGCSNDARYEESLRRHLTNNMMKCSIRNIKVLAADVAGFL